MEKEKKKIQLKQRIDTKPIVDVSTGSSNKHFLELTYPPNDSIGLPPYSTDLSVTNINQRGGKEKKAMLVQSACGVLLRSVGDFSLPAMFAKNIISRSSAVTLD